jgi:hypothetical protein
LLQKATFIGGTSFLCFSAALYYESQPFCYLTVFLIGFFITPVIPLSFELACELVFPVGEALAVGMLLTGG